jgi:hypothetical protein
MAPSATGLVGVHGFDLARDAVVELQVLVCECVRSEVAQIVDSLRCVSEGSEHSGVFFWVPAQPSLLSAHRAKPLLAIVLSLLARHTVHVVAAKQSLPGRPPPCRGATRAHLNRGGITFGAMITPEGLKAGLIHGWKSENALHTAFFCLPPVLPEGGTWF